LDGKKIKVPARAVNHPQMQKKKLEKGIREGFRYSKKKTNHTLVV